MEALSSRTCVAAAQPAADLQARSSVLVESHSNIYSDKGFKQEIVTLPHNSDLEIYFQLVILLPSSQVAVLVQACPAATLALTFWVVVR
ncbi:hypothetical protein XENOCAPTIV_030082 [Xenoophorus captivus]|uniref:Uncharacterized protein n=1 Tax=Xenoophorus captivus TaxID=1517983 RepID=A0ABV0S2E9_9TELE